MSYTAISKLFNIGRNTVFTWTKKLHPEKHRNKKQVKIDLDRLQQDVEEYRDAYQYERAKRLGVSKSGIEWALKKLNITYKKSSKTSEGKRRREIGISTKN